MPGRCEQRLSVSCAAPDRVPASTATHGNAGTFLTMNMDQLPDRAAALGVNGLRDVAAALPCMCQCHHRRFGRPTHVRPDGTSMYDHLETASGPLHDDGPSCPCQSTPEERDTSREQLFSAMAELTAAMEPGREAMQRDLERATATAGRLGLTDVKLVTEACPFYLELRDSQGREVALRERHGTWTVRVDGEEIAAGDDTDLDAADGWLEGDAVVAGPVTRAVLVISEQLARHDGRACDHAAAERFCPACGVYMAGVEL
jgi:hypothetical protein